MRIVDVRIEYPAIGIDGDRHIGELKALDVAYPIRAVTAAKDALRVASDHGAGADLRNSEEAFGILAEQRDIIVGHDVAIDGRIHVGGIMTDPKITAGAAIRVRIPGVAVRI